MKAILFDIQGVLYGRHGLDKDLAAFIKEKGSDYIMAACSASGDAIKAALERDGLLDAFAYVWTSENSRFSKNDPKLYEEIAQTLGVEPGEILFLDDVVPFVRAARTAGLRAIHYTPLETGEHNHLFDNLS